MKIYLRVFAKGKGSIYISTFALFQQIRAHLSHQLFFDVLSRGVYYAHTGESEAENACPRVLHNTDKKDERESNARNIVRIKRNG